MGKTILTFGLISGGILAIMMVITMTLFTDMSFDVGEVVGYTTMVLAFLMVFFGVRSYRDNISGGAISFGRAFSVGALIVVVAAVCYMVTWEILYFKVAPAKDFAQRFEAHMMERARAKSPEELQDMRKFMERYRKPWFNAAITFVEPLPAGLVLALISAGVLRRRRPPTLGDAV
jgi:hypothetical protein